MWEMRERAEYRMMRTWGTSPEGMIYLLPHSNCRGWALFWHMDLTPTLILHCEVTYCESPPHGSPSIISQYIEFLQWKMSYRASLTCQGVKVGVTKKGVA